MCHMPAAQYRMHPSIRRFPSAHFYHDHLRDGERVLYAARVPIGAHEGPPGFLAPARPAPVELRYAPMCFFNLLDGEQHRSGETHSLRNEREARFCARLLLSFLSSADAWRGAVAAAAAAVGADSEQPSGLEPAQRPQPCMGSGCCLGPGQRCAWGGLCGRVAILTPYKEQCRALEQELSHVFGPRQSWSHALEYVRTADPSPPPSLPPSPSPPSPPPSAPPPSLPWFSPPPPRPRRPLRRPLRRP